MVVEPCFTGPWMGKGAKRLVVFNRKIVEFGAKEPGRRD